MKSDLCKVVFTERLDNSISTNIIEKNLLKLLNMNHKKAGPFFGGKPLRI